MPDNPTSVLIRRLRSEERICSTEDNTNNSDATAATNITSDSNIAIEETHILETSVEYVRAWFDDLRERLKSSTPTSTTSAMVDDSKINIEKADDGDTTIHDSSEVTNAPTNYPMINTDDKHQTPTTTVLLHLGVDYNATQFKLEQCAYNDATFRVPDERGYQPHCECILLSVDDNENSGSRMEASSSSGDHHHPSWGKCLRTTIDLLSLCNELHRCTDENVIISTDPGRFVCNYTYYLSLDRCHSINGNSNGVDNNQRAEEGGCANNEDHALFLHVPPFEVISEERQMIFIKQVMVTIGGIVESAKRRTGKITRVVNRYQYS